MANCFKITKRSFATYKTLHNVFNHVTVIGGGLMGSGIAQVTAQAGIDVTIVEINDEAVKRSEGSIKNSMQRVAKKLFQGSTSEAEKYMADTLGRLKISMKLEETVSHTDLVVEAIVEDLGTKHKLFSRIDSFAPEKTIFASNTSSLPISEIASVTTRKDRFGGLHFFNPVPVMKLLEVIRTEDTSDETYQKMLAFGKAIGKTCITCKDTPGFVVNRLLVPYLAEGARMLERGDASAKDIDIAMKLGAGYPMGPLELLDYVGLDTTKFILDGWHKKYPNNPLFTPINLLDKLVNEGKLGKKTGEGFYSYKKYTKKTILPASSYSEPLPSSLSSPPPLTSIKKVKVKKVQESQNPIPADYSRKERQERLRKLTKLKELEKERAVNVDIERTRDAHIWQLKKKIVSPQLNMHENHNMRDLQRRKHLEDLIRVGKGRNIDTVVKQNM